MDAVRKTTVPELHGLWPKWSRMGQPWLPLSYTDGAGTLVRSDDRLRWCPIGRADRACLVLALIARLGVTNETARRVSGTRARL